MESLLKVLTDSDKNLISTYIARYIENYNSETPEYSLGYSDFAPLEYRLRYWDENKSKFLYKLLEENFTISKKFIVNIPDRYYNDQLSDLVWNTEISKIFADALEETNDVELMVKYSWGETFLTSDDFRSRQHWYNFTSSLFNTESLRNNKYISDSCVEYTIYYLKDDKKKKIAIENGIKVIRILQKLVALINKEEITELFEDFRLRHSRIMNIVKREEEVFLSIHPMDYLTMSDNSLDWCSCMSWTSGKGCYRRGTVEMMTSPCVIVAYTKSDTDFNCVHNFKDNKDLYWNNKKWRSLFIVTPEIISSVKAYPYQNYHLTKVIVNWLSELAEKNCGFSYNPSLCERSDYDYCLSVYDNTIASEVNRVEFTTNFMYNDFDAGVKVYYKYNYEKICSTSPEEHSKDLALGESLRINYSGPATCMACGETISFENNNVIDDEGYVVCSQCCTLMSVYCYCCGDIIYLDDNDEYYYDETKDRYYCGCCSNNLSTCPNCGGIYAASNGAASDVIALFKDRKSLSPTSLKSDAKQEEEKTGESCSVTQYIENNAEIIKICSECFYGHNQYSSPHTIYDEIYNIAYSQDRGCALRGYFCLDKDIALKHPGLKALYENIIARKKEINNPFVL